jgi:hypothetical protein
MDGGQSLNRRADVDRQRRPSFDNGLEVGIQGGFPRLWRAFVWQLAGMTACDSTAVKPRCVAFGGGAEFSFKKALLIFCFSPLIFAIFRPPDLRQECFS